MAMSRVSQTSYVRLVLFIYLSVLVFVCVLQAWSITYHSWLTFVLLLWACVLWMIPNQRAAMLRCSPFLVIYAEVSADSF